MKLKLKTILREDYEEDDPSFRANFPRSGQYGGNYEQILETFLTNYESVQILYKKGQMSAEEALERIEDITSIIYELREELYKWNVRPKLRGR